MTTQAGAIVTHENNSFQQTFKASQFYVQYTAFLSKKNASAKAEKVDLIFYLKSGDEDIFFHKFCNFV